jgi:outer membrane protein assembly factor BamD
MPVRLRRLTVILFLLFFIISCATTEKAPPAFDPQASLNKATEKMNDGYYEEAREILQKVVEKDASQQYALLAKLKIADSYFDDEQYEEAATEYENFLKVHEQHKFSSYAQYHLAMSYFKRIKTPDVSFSTAKKALEEFEKLQRKYPRNPYMEVTESRIQSCKRVLAEHEFYVGEFYFNKGSFEAAISRLQELLDTYPGSVKESEALYFMGLSYENLGQRDNAVTTLTTLIRKFPATELSNEARKLIASFDD